VELAVHLLKLVRSYAGFVVKVGGDRSGRQAFG
jgi:hypothetical protein